MLAAVVLVAAAVAWVPLLNVEKEGCCWWRWWHLTAWAEASDSCRSATRVVAAVVLVAVIVVEAVM